MECSDTVEVFHIQNDIYYPDFGEKNISFFVIIELLYLGHFQGHLKVSMILWL